MRRASGPDLSRWAATALLAAACSCGAPERLLDGTLVAFRGHQELAETEGASPVPWVLGHDATIGICLEPAATRDTSEWVGRVSIGAAGSIGGTFVAPSHRLGATLCFAERVPVDLADGPSVLCLDLRDDYDGATDRVCLPFRFRDDGGEHARIETRIAQLLGQGADVAGLDALGREARDPGFPFLELRLRLISVYKLRRAGSSEARALAEARAAESPPWLASRAAARWAAQLAYERATLALDAGALEPAWRELRLSESGFRAVADPKWIVAVTKQVEILSRVGALGEALGKLRFALGQCASAPCETRLARMAESMLSWLVLLDPDADADALAEAEGRLRTVLAEMGDDADDVERANVLVNLAYARERQGLDPRQEIERARDLLPEASELARWSEVIEGLHATRSGDAERGRSTCDAVLAAPGTSRLRAWAATCAASALRESGDLERAADRLALAWLLGERALGSGIDQQIPIDPGQRAETAYRAALVAIERDRAHEAWQMLTRLDGLAAGAMPAASPEREALLAELVALEAPAAPARRAQRESIHRSTLERLQELARAASPVDRDPATDDPGVSFRAFALDDEIVLLHRPLGGSPALYRRTALPRTELLRAVRELTDAIVSHDVDQARWRAAAQPLAAALVPDPADLGPLTTFALHGILQSVPLHALPLQNGWLGDATAVAYRPAGAAGRAVDTSAGTHLFVVDPENSLDDHGAAQIYRSVTPRTQVLEGAQATVAAIEQALATASSFHIDAHARYDAAFPELSSLELADGPLTAQQIARWAPHLELANLSACHSGSWPVTADSGRFGLAGSLARQGVTWVIASRAELEDTLAADFNRAFYARLAQGDRVPVAFQAALAQARDRHPASSWAALLLLESGAISGGQTGVGRTLLTFGPTFGDRQ